MNAEARLRLVEALVMAAGGTEAPPRREALERLVGRLGAGGGPTAGVTLAGALIRVLNGQASLSQAPPRKDAERSRGPDWDRALALLQEPRLEALAV
jgi:hypothetical protein